jgi:hypothetical protein
MSTPTVSTIAEANRKALSSPTLITLLAVTSLRDLYPFEENPCESLSDAALLDVMKVTWPEVELEADAEGVTVGGMRYRYPFMNDDFFTSLCAQA